MTGRESLSYTYKINDRNSRHLASNPCMPQIQVCMARKLELVNAEGLFGLDTTEYPELQRVVSELKKLGRIYDLYQEQRDFEDGNSATPWGDLDVGSLQRGVEVLEKKARKEKQFKDHPTFRAVEARIFNFKDSIPLIVNLKNEAMKPRHWQKLIEVSCFMLTTKRYCIGPKNLQITRSLNPHHTLLHAFLTI